jgi:cytoskeletal protein CcmA (bactofilin family)
MKTMLTTMAPLLLVALLVWFSEGWGFKLYSSPNIKLLPDSVIVDDVYLTGDKIKMDASVDGDVVGFCRSLVYDGKLKGSLNVFSYQTVVFGVVEGSLRCFCYQIDVNSSVERDLLAFGNKVNLGPGGTIKNDALMYCNEATVDGDVGRDLTVGCAKVTIGGTIGGDVDLEAERIYILPTASIKGNLTYKSPEPAKIESGATILGVTDWQEVEKDGKKKGKNLFAILPGMVTNMVIFQIAMGGLSLLTGLIYSGILSAAGVALVVPILLIIAVMIASLVMVGLSRRFTESVREKARRQSLKSFSLGLVVFIVAPMVIIMLIASFLGMPLGVLATLLFVLLALLGWIFFAYFLGDLILRVFSPQKGPSRFLSTVFGVVALLFLGIIPAFVGFFITLVAMLWGLGAVLSASYGLLRPAEKATEVPATPA